MRTVAIIMSALTLVSSACDGGGSPWPPASGNSGADSGGGMAGSGGTASGTGGFGGVDSRAESGPSDISMPDDHQPIDSGGMVDTSLPDDGHAIDSGAMVDAPLGRECWTATDCRLTSDCCNCESLPVGAVGRACATDCDRSQCDAEGIAANEVACVARRCVIARSCDVRQVACDALAPSCPPGTIPSVRGDCWGPCLPVTECQLVSDCAACQGALCVQDSQIGGRKISCVKPIPGCTSGNYCECLQACSAGCTESALGVDCYCSGC